MAAILTALSPAMGFFSRYYIHECLLVFFAFGAIVAAWRHTRTEGWPSALMAGLALGFMFATKETCILSFVAMAGSLLLMEIWTRVLDGRRLYAHKDICSRHHIPALAVSAILCILLFSEFLTNPNGPIDFLANSFLLGGPVRPGQPPRTPMRLLSQTLALDPA